MFWRKRAPALLLGLLWAAPACAFTFSYGGFFDVKDVQNENGVLTLPLSRGKYKDVKVLDKNLYDFLHVCRGPCRYEVQEIKFQSTDYRIAFTNEDLLIADIDFNDEIALTFLVGKKETGFWIKTPDEVVFRDETLRWRVEEHLVRLAEQSL